MDTPDVDALNDSTGTAAVFQKAAWQSVRATHEDQTSPDAIATVSNARQGRGLNPDEFAAQGWVLPNRVELLADHICQVPIRNP